MLRLHLTVLLSAAAVVTRNFSICEEWSGKDFFDNFFFWPYSDPTHGKVDYVNQKEAQKSNLSYVDQDTGRFVMQVDWAGPPVPLHGNTSDKGRKSVRLHSNRLYADGLYILKATWMPQGCGYVMLIFIQNVARILDRYTYSLAQRR